MKMTLTELRNKLHGINLEEEGLEVMVESSDMIIGLNQKQLLDNTDIDGDILPYVTEDYYKHKATVSIRLSRRYNMFLTGRSFSTMFLSFDKYEYAIKSRGEMQNWHDSPDSEYRDYLDPFIVLGLTEEHKQIYRHSTFLPNLVKRINEAII